jgi:hypothetical protein
MHFLRKSLAFINAAIAAISSMPRLQAAVKRADAVCIRECKRWKKASKAAEAAFITYERLAAKAADQGRAVHAAEKTLQLAHHQLSQARKLIASAITQVADRRAISEYDRMDVIFDAMKLERIEFLLVEGRVNLARMTVRDWEEQVELATERLANAEPGLVESANNHLCHCIRRVKDAEGILKEMQAERATFGERLEERWQMKEAARIARKAKAAQRRL